MGKMECYVCDNKWIQEGRPDGKGFCVVGCLKTLYRKEDLGELYEIVIESIKRRNKENGLKFRD